MTIKTSANRVPNFDVEAPATVEINRPCFHLIKLTQTLRENDFGVNTLLFDDNGEFLNLVEQPDGVFVLFEYRAVFVPRTQWEAQLR